MKDWEQYQEDAAAYFRTLGVEASTNVSIQGVRSSHDVDVLVKSHHVGFDITWIVECKYWKSPVNKLHVLALREIVADTGADKGILLSEAGFQSGAQEAANLTNVQLTSIKGMQEIAIEDINAMRLRELFERADVCKERYWDISKEDRSKYGLRPYYYEHNYSGDLVIKACLSLLGKAFRGSYPFKCDDAEVVAYFGWGKSFESSREVVNWVDQALSELESKLDNCELHLS